MQCAGKKRKEPPAPLFIGPGVVTGALLRSSRDVGGSRAAGKLCGRVCGRVFRTHGGPHNWNGQEDRLLRLAKEPRRHEYPSSVHSITRWIRMIC